MTFRPPTATASGRRRRNIEARLTEGTATLVHGRMGHCPPCGGRLVPIPNSVGFWGNGDVCFVERCPRGCSWSQEVRARRVAPADIGGGPS